MRRWVLQFFCIFIVKKNTFYVPASFYENLLILEILLESASEFTVMCVIVIPSSLYNNIGGISKGIGNLNQPLILRPSKKIIHLVSQSL
jgi:hypothetical protein